MNWMNIRHFIPELRKQKGFFISYSQFSRNANANEWCNASKNSITWKSEYFHYDEIYTYTKFECETFVTSANNQIIRL